MVSMEVDTGKKKGQDLTTVKTNKKEYLLGVEYNIQPAEHLLEAYARATRG